MNQKILGTNDGNSVKVVCIIVARNEEEHLGETLYSLEKQTLPLSGIIVVDDGSHDHTTEIALNHDCHLIWFDPHKENYVGRPELAERWNAALRYVRDVLGDIDYVLLLGADHSLPPDYVESVLSRMNGKVVIASGHIEDEPYVEAAPRGSGRLVDAKFWLETNRLQYPVCYGWESWLPLKSRQLGYEPHCFSDITSKVQRKTGLSKADNLGKAMYALGYDMKYAAGRSVLTFFENPGAGWSMFRNYLLHKDIERLDIADWVNQMQKKRFWSRIWRIIRCGGRKV